MVQSILDQPIPKKLRLIKPLSPSIQPYFKVKEKKKTKKSFDEFDPLPKKLRTTTDYQKEILNLYNIFYPEQALDFFKNKWGIKGFLKGWRMDIKILMIRSVS